MALAEAGTAWLGDGEATLLKQKGMGMRVKRKTAHGRGKGRGSGLGGMFWLVFWGMAAEAGSMGRQRGVGQKVEKCHGADMVVAGICNGHVEDKGRIILRRQAGQAGGRALLEKWRRKNQLCLLSSLPLSLLPTS